jgi:hypothetical protein
MYNNNPHYNLNGIDFYLNPISQDINYFKEKLSYDVSDYDTIVIHDRTYFEIRLENDNVIIYGNKQDKNEDRIWNIYMSKLKSLVE